MMCCHEYFESAACIYWLGVIAVKLAPAKSNKAPIYTSLPVQTLHIRDVLADIRISYRNVPSMLH